MINRIRGFAIAGLVLSAGAIQVYAAHPFTVQNKDNVGHRIWVYEMDASETEKRPYSVSIGPNSNAGWKPGFTPDGTDGGIWRMTMDNVSDPFMAADMLDKRGKKHKRWINTSWNFVIENSKIKSKW